MTALLTSEIDRTVQGQAEDPVLTDGEAARLLRINVSKLRELTACGRIKSIKIGYRTLRWRRADLLAFLDTL